MHKKKGLGGTDRAELPYQQMRTRHLVRRDSAFFI